MGVNYIVITNNPYVYEKMAGIKVVKFYDVNYIDILKVVRDEVHKGARLLTHPLSGSVKPKETPYKSLLIKEGKSVDGESVEMIENAILTCAKFQDKTGLYSEAVYKDFQLIDWGLIKGAIESADSGWL